MHVKAIEWTGRYARLIDQTLLPGKEKYIIIRDEKAMWEAIKKLRIRGAPAIGVAAAFGLYLGVRRHKPSTFGEVKRATRKVANYLATSRPTAVNLFWALNRCEELVESFERGSDPKAVLEALLQEALTIQKEDQETCDAMGRHGAKELKGAKAVLTHCNTGALATAGSGTAFSVIYHLAKKRKSLLVYADETRPLLQGARLTAWELKKARIDYRLITDNTAGMVLQKGMVEAIVVGSDRIASNGDAANKIGTMPLAVVAKHFKIPFYVAAPLSTFDMELKSGDEIPIEERGSDEVTKFGGTSVAPAGTKTFSPAFDVTPAKLIAGIITEKGVLKAPYKSSIKKAFES